MPAHQGMSFTGCVFLTLILYTVYRCSQWIRKISVWYYIQQDMKKMLSAWQQKTPCFFYKPAAFVHICQLHAMKTMKGDDMSGSRKFMNFMSINILHRNILHYLLLLYLIILLVKIVMCNIFKYVTDLWA